MRLVVATTDPATLPAISTWYLTTNLPVPGSERAANSAQPAADLAEVVRLYGLCNWVEQGYKQVKHELGWADFMVRADQAIRRHWQLVCCAFSFCWQAWFAEETRLAPTLAPVPHAEASAPLNSVDLAGQPAGRGEMETDSRPNSTPIITWPMTLRRVRAWLDPWSRLWRWWRACSTAPPPPAIQALLHAVGTGQPLYPYLLE